MRDKNVAGILALFFGWAGIHRFYLGQVGLGILYAILLFTGISAILGLIDAIVFFSMDQEVFDYKYNEAAIRRRRRMQQRRRKYDTDFDRNDRRRERRVDQYRSRERKRDLSEQSRTERQKYYKRPTPKPVKSNPYKNSGIKKYKDYDYDGAIEDFKKALEINENDIAVHFNIACAYSLNEEAEKAFYHLDKAVDLGFNDFKRIKEHDALAFLRIQSAFETFEANGFRVKQAPPAAPPPEKEDVLDLAASLKEEEEKTDSEESLQLESGDLLEQLKKLGELRDKGLLTEEEFVVQKRKLLE